MWDIAISMFIVILGICDVGNNNINGLWEWDQAHKKQFPNQDALFFSHPWLLSRHMAQNQNQNSLMDFSEA
jgi:hypothetical protein